VRASRCRVESGQGRFPWSSLREHGEGEGKKYGDGWGTGRRVVAGVGTVPWGPGRANPTEVGSAEGKVWRCLCMGKGDPWPRGVRVP
jgi:hypothetical protein